MKSLRHAFPTALHTAGAQHTDTFPFRSPRHKQARSFMLPSSHQNRHDALQPTPPFRRQRGSHPPCFAFPRHGTGGAHLRPAPHTSQVTLTALPPTLLPARARAPFQSQAHGAIRPHQVPRARGTQIPAKAHLPVPNPACICCRCRRRSGRCCGCCCCYCCSRAPRAHFRGRMPAGEYSLGTRLSRNTYRLYELGVGVWWPYLGTRGAVGRD